MNEVERLSAYIKEHVNQPPLKRFVKEAIDIDPRLLIMAGHNPNNVKYVWYYDSASNKIIGSYKSKSHDDQEFADISSKSDVTRGRVFEYNGETYLIIYGAIAAARNPTPEEVRNIYLQVSDIYDGNIDYVIDEEGNDVSDLTESVINEVRCPRCKHQYTTQCRCRSFTSDDGKKTTYTCEKCGKKFEVEREKSFWDGTKVGESKISEKTLRPLYDMADRYDADKAVIHDSIKLKENISKESWNIIHSAIKDVVSNFYKITGVEGYKTIDPLGQFHQDVIDKTIPKIEAYIESNYPDLYNDKKAYDEGFLYELDDALMAKYSEEAIEKAGGYEKVYGKNESKVNDGLLGAYPPAKAGSKKRYVFDFKSHDKSVAIDAIDDEEAFKKLASQLHKEKPDYYSADLNSYRDDVKKGDLTVRMEESKIDEVVFGTPFVGNNSDKKLAGGELFRAIRFAVAAEYEAVQLYMQIHDSTDDELTKKVMKSVAEEEIVHAGEFIHLLMTLSPEETDLYAQGTAEVEDKIDNKETKSPDGEGEPVDKDKQLVTGVEAEPKSEEKKEVPKESILRRFVDPVIKEGVDYSAMNAQDAAQHVRDLYLKMGIQDPTGYENRRTIQHEIDRANAAIKSRQGKA